MTEGSAEAAGVRIRSTAARLAELRVRLERLQRGDPSTPEDVERARQQAQAQARAQAAARQRLLVMHRSAAVRHERHAQRFASAGRTQPADREREAALREHEVIAGLLATEAPSPHQPPVVEAEPPPPSGRPGDDEARARLQGGLVALLSWAGDADLEDVEHHRSWCRAVVDQCAEPNWRGWSHAVCLVARSVLPEVRGVAVTVLGGSGSTQVTAASDPWTAKVQELELIAGEGPSLTAQAANRAVQVADLAAEQDGWQRYATLAAEHVVRGISAVPLRVRGLCLGSLTLYTWSAAGPSQPDPTDSTAFADIAAGALIADVEQVRLDGPLGGSPFAVHVAIGALSAQLGVTDAEAESRLRAYAFSAGLSLLEAAQQVIDGDLDLG